MNGMIKPVHHCPICEENGGHCTEQDPCCCCIAREIEEEEKEIERDKNVHSS